MFDPAVITAWIVGQLQWHAQRLHMRAFWASAPDSATPYAVQLHGAIESSPLREEINLLCRVANGEIARDSASPEQVAEVIGTIQEIAETLCVPPWGPGGYDIAREFWATPAGEVMLHAQRWARGEELITYSEAARILDPLSWSEAITGEARTRAQEAARARVRRLVEAGELMGYLDPQSEGTGPGRRSDRRVSRRDVEAIVAQRLAEAGEDGDDI
jgi:hypothetical protein